MKSGIAALVPGATIDDFAFDPCGYSMNAITYGNYATVRLRWSWLVGLGVLVVLVSHIRPIRTP